MPHIVVEYSAPLADQYDLDALCKELCDAAISTGVFPKPDDIKVRAMPASHWHRPAEDQSFAHVMVRLLSGRTEEQKKSVTAAILQAMENRLSDVAALTVDTNDINRETYAKRTL